MKTALFSILLLSTAHGELAKPLRSPDGRFIIQNVTADGARHFEVHDRAGHTVLSGGVLPGLDPWSRHALDAAWSGDGTALAITVHATNYTHDVIAFVLRDGGFASVPLPETKPDFSSDAVRWRGSHDLVLAVSGPWGRGKAAEEYARSFSRYFCTLRLSAKSDRFDTVYTSKRIHPYYRNT